MDRIPTPEELDAHYGVYAYGREVAVSPETQASYNVLLDEFEAYRKTGRILDVGCGRGWFLDEARKRGWEVHGTEFSTTAVELCRAKGIAMQQGVLDPAGYPAEGFDVITSFEVLEHINDPHDEMARIVPLLRRGGLFYCTTPNFDSVMRYYLKAEYNIIGYPEHLSYYTKRTLTRMVEQHGLELRRFMSTGLSLTRLRTSKRPEGGQQVGADDADERLRREIGRKWYLAVAKRAVNTLLTATNTGLTLKGWFVKP